MKCVCFLEFVLFSGNITALLIMRQARSCLVKRYYQRRFPFLFAWREWPALRLAPHANAFLGARHWFE